MSNTHTAAVAPMVSAEAFDYNQLDDTTRDFVQQCTGEIKVLMRRTAQDIIDIGRKLIEVKARLGHGYYVAWLNAEFGWSRSTAHRFVSVAKTMGDSIQMLHGETFDAKALYILASGKVPQSAREEAIDRAQQGERITTKVAKQIKASHVTGHDSPESLVRAYINTLREETRQRVLGNIGRGSPASAAHVQRIYEKGQRLYNFQAIRKAVSSISPEYGRDSAELTIIQPPAQPENRAADGLTNHPPTDKPVTSSDGAADRGVAVLVGNTAPSSTYPPRPVSLAKQETPNSLIPVVVCDDQPPASLEADAGGSSSSQPPAPSP